MLPPTKPTTTKKPASAAAARRASIEAIAKRNSTAVTLPWLDATIVTASVEARARSIGGRAVAMAGAATPDSTDLPLKAEILRKNPTLIAGASECAAVGLILHEVEELRATLKRKHPSLSWVPWIALLPQLKTSSASGTPPSSSSRGQLHERSLAQQQLAHRALASAKRFVVQLGKDGAVAARGEGGAASARCLLQLLMAERQALLLMLLRERICAKPVLPESPYLSLSGNPFRSRTFSDLVGGPETARLRKEVAFQASQVLLKNQLHELAKANYEKARNSKRSQVATAVVAEVDTSRLRTDLAGVKAALHDAQWRLSHAEEATRRRVHEEVQSEMKAISLEINFMTRALADSATIDMSEVKKALQKISSTQRTTFSSTRSAHSSPEKGLKESLREAMRDRIAESSKERDDVQLLVFKQMMFSRFTLAVAESIHSRKMRALAASSRKPSFRRKDSEEADEETEVLEAVRAAEAEKTAVTDQLHALEAEIAQLERDHAVLLKGKVDRITKPISLVVEEMTANCNSPRGVKG
ncbi:hypothetical protein AB1Y20_019031 [Prymnesium parvum]|uniref:Dynein regulatory complex protein 10 n=1 Tax=Prymnesium parvum TaxID=97485 RepID=A0AB34JT09_PRYPA